MHASDLPVLIVVNYSHFHFVAHLTITEVLRTAQIAKSRFSVSQVFLGFAQGNSQSCFMVLKDH